MAERRRYPRVSGAFPLQLGQGPEAVAAKTLNISCGGALCRVDRPIPAMTRVTVALALPTRRIRCVGAVVRCRGGTAAVYFMRMRGADRRALAEFVLNSMLGRMHGRRRS